MMNRDTGDPRGPIDARTWDLLGGDTAPELDISLWPEVRRRTAGTPRHTPLARLSFAGLGLACLALGLWLGLGFAPGMTEKRAIAPGDDYVEGSYLSDDAWTLDGLYLMAGAENTTSGATR